VAISTAQPVRFPDAFLEVRSKIFPTRNLSCRDCAKDGGRMQCSQLKINLRFSKRPAKRPERKAFATAPNKSRGQQAHHPIKGP
jgi:hypothetical protein